MLKDGMMNVILKGGRIVDPARNVDEAGDIGIMDGRIVAPETVKKPKTFDLRGLVVAPGFIDMHVHLRQPGQTASETIRTGSMAAAAGGFTGIVAMPNTSPAADTPGDIEYVRRHGEQDAVVNVFPCGCMTRERKGQEMAGIGGLKAAGVIALSDDGGCIQNHSLMRHVVEYAKTFELPILDHCEDAILAGDGIMHEGKWSTLLGVRGIPSAAEELMVCRDIIISRITEWRIHIQHVSAKESVERLRQAIRQGIRVSAEVTPHHLALTDEEIKRFDTGYKMNPPLRSEEDRQALIEGLRDGTIAVIATDHAPHTETDKLVELDYAPFGVIGLETAVPVCLTELVHKGFLSLSQMIAKFTVGPASILNLAKGTLSDGADADITVLDPDQEYRIDAGAFLSKSRNTPFDGMAVRGRTVATWVGGTPVYSRIPECRATINA